MKNDDYILKFLFYLNGIVLCTRNIIATAKMYQYLNKNNMEAKQCLIKL